MSSFTSSLNPALEIKKCDQKILIQVETIIDKTLKDIIPRKKVYLKIDIVNIAIYDLKNKVYSVVDAQNFEYLKRPVKFVSGDPRCIIITVYGKNNFTICFKDKDDAMAVWKSIGFIYERCRKTKKLDQFKKKKEQAKECINKYRLKLLKDKNFLAKIKNFKLNKPNEMKKKI